MLEVAKAQPTGGAPGHQVATDVLVVGDDDAVAAEDAAAAPAPRAEDVAFDACAVRLGQADHATGRVEIAIADLDVAPAQDRQPIAAAEADLQALAIAAIDLLGLGMAVVQIRPHPQAPQEDVAGLGGARVGGDDRLVIRAVKGHVLEAEVVRAADQRLGRMGEIGPEQVDQLPLLATQDREPRHAQHGGDEVAAAGKIDHAAAVLLGGRQRRPDRRRVVLHAGPLGGEILDVEDGLRPGWRFFHAGDRRLAPGPAAPAAVVHEDLVVSDAASPPAERRWLHKRRLGPSAPRSEGATAASRRCRRPTPAVP